MRTWRVRGDEADAETLDQAAEALRSGGVLVVPTETYYGLAADLRRPEALERVRCAKGRGQDKPLLLLLQGVAAARALAPGASPRLEALAAAFWPGPLTLVLPAGEGLPRPVVSPGGGVAVRHSPHPVLADLLARLGGPVTGTSANLAGRPPARTVGELELGPGAADGIVDAGPCPGGAPSTVLDLTEEPPRILRHGAVTASRLRRLL